MCRFATPRGSDGRGLSGVGGGQNPPDSGVQRGGGDLQGTAAAVALTVLQAEAAQHVGGDDDALTSTFGPTAARSRQQLPNSTAGCSACTPTLCVGSGGGLRAGRGGG